ncbi:signal transduction histidine kinase [Massilia umbonata]|uniref:histidine kinase n=2 Tax=Pseudoduganella umbonata TaxID=864828 RepID=A0A4P8HYL0_9BURK|nr:signal transduction histidine kinase [Pseudoduganella umbonata]QCP13634.1 HAMP domain-containing histidine kinase [Pseudoduganella umbonata]
MLTVELHNEFDVFSARQRALQVAAICGFSSLNQVRLGTIVSDIVRSVVSSGAPGTLQFSLGGAMPSTRLGISIATGAANPLDRSALTEPLRLANDWADTIDYDQAGGSIVMWRACPASSSLTMDSFATGLAKVDASAADMRRGSTPHQDPLHQKIAGLTADNSVLAARADMLERQARQFEERQLSNEVRYAAAVKADAQKGEFLAVLAHELRSPLSAVNGAADLLINASHLDAARVASIGKLVKRQVGYMSRLAEDLLDVSRFERGTMALGREVIDLGQVTESAIEQVGALIAAKVQAVRMVACADAVVLGDRTRLTQVMSNLLSNASRYSPSGSEIRIRLAIDGEHAVVEIADDGIGIDPQLIPTMFDLYVQADLTVAARDSGLGLGLALVKRLVEAHAGTVSAHSDGKDAGSTFSVRLPRHRGQ